MYSARDLLSKEELEFLLTALPDEDSSNARPPRGQDASNNPSQDISGDTADASDADGADGIGRANEAGGQNRENQQEHPCSSDNAPDDLDDEVPDASDDPDDDAADPDEPDAPAVAVQTAGANRASGNWVADDETADKDETEDWEEESAAACDPLEQKALFFSNLLERELTRRTGGLIALEVADISVMAQERLFNMLEEPASYTLLTGLPLARRLLFYCDTAVTAGLADLSLGAGHALAPSRRPLSFLDLELVRRCLELVPQCLAQAFDLPCCKTLRHGQYADDIFLTRQESLLHVVTLSMELEGVRGAGILAIPAR